MLIWHRGIFKKLVSAFTTLEIQNRSTTLNFLKPFAGFLGTDDSQFYGYGGLSSDLYFLRCKCFVVTPSLAFGFYDDGEGIRMGHLVEFRSGGDFTYRFKNNVRLGLGIFHISNAGMGYRNPGTEQIIFKYQIPIN